MRFFIPGGQFEQPLDGRQSLVQATCLAVEARQTLPARGDKVRQSPLLIPGPIFKERRIGQAQSTQELSAVKFEYLGENLGVLVKRDALKTPNHLHIQPIGQKPVEGNRVPSYREMVAQDLAHAVEQRAQILAGLSFGRLKPEQFEELITRDRTLLQRHIGKKSQTFAD